jgi:hypothetical protein
MSEIFGGETEEEIPEAPQEETTLEVEEPEETVEAKAPSEELEEDKKVSLSALNESRAQLRQTQNELAQMREQMAKFEQMREQLDEYRRSTQQKSEEDEFNTDPLGTLRKQISGIEDKIVTRDQEQRESSERQQQEQHLFQTISSQVVEFKSSHPDYDSALNHVLETRKNELMAMGATEQDAQMRVAAEAQEIALTAVNSGRNAGEVVYQLAKARGYEGKKAADKLSKIDKGQKASNTLSGSSGAPDSEIGIAEIDGMNDEEFDKWWDKNINTTPHH